MACFAPAIRNNLTVIYSNCYAAAMDTSCPPDIVDRLPRDLYYQIVHALRGALPPPVSDAPADLIRRDNAIIAQVASLLPANPDEVILAAQYVAANAQAFDCLRLAHENQANLAVVLQCTAQSASMMRQARSARTHLLRARAARGHDSAGSTEHAVVSLMADAMGRTAPDPAPAPPPAADVSTRLTEAEKYALAHPRRAALIRSIGGRPRKLNLGPLSAALVHEIAHGTSPILRALGRKPSRRLAA